MQNYGGWRASSFYMGAKDIDLGSLILPRRVYRTERYRTFRLGKSDKQSRRILLAKRALQRVIADNGSRTAVRKVDRDEHHKDISRKPAPLHIVIANFG